MGLIYSPSVFSASTIIFSSFERFCNNNLHFHRQGTIIFLTPNCQSDPEWSPKTKLESQDLLAGSLHQDLITESR